MILNRNKRTINGKQVHYVFFDESGHPYYLDGDTFLLDAILTSDPEKLAQIALTKESNTRDSRKNRHAPGKGELKHARSNRTVCNQVMSEVREQDLMKASAAAVAYTFTCIDRTFREYPYMTYGVDFESDLYKMRQITEP